MLAIGKAQPNSIHSRPLWVKKVYQGSDAKIWPPLKCCKIVASLVAQSQTQLDTVNDASQLHHPSTFQETSSLSFLAKEDRAKKTTPPAKRAKPLFMREAVTPYNWKQRPNNNIIFEERIPDRRSNRKLRWGEKTITLSKMKTAQEEHKQTRGEKMPETSCEMGQSIHQHRTSTATAGAMPSFNTKTSGSSTAKQRNSTVFGMKSLSMNNQI